MASVKDIATMESIQSIVEACAVSKIRPEIILSNGVPLLQKSINAVRNAGAWATDIALIGFIVSFFIIINGTDEIGMKITIIVIELVALNISASFALKLYHFKHTPASALIYIILSGVFACFAAPYMFLPFILLPIISALIRWSTYRNWFKWMSDKIENDDGYASRLRIRGMMGITADNTQSQEQPELIDKPAPKPKTKTDGSAKQRVTRLLREAGLSDKEIAQVTRDVSSGKKTPAQVIAEIESRKNKHKKH